MNLQNNNIAQRHTFTARILTPIHIGSGNKLRKDLDFYSTNDSTYIVPMQDILNYISNTPAEQEKLIKDNYDPKKLLMHVAKDMHRYETACDVQDIHEIIRNGFGRPYIPGSSLKGAIRSILFGLYAKDKAASLIQLINEKRAETADRAVVDTAFGKEMNYNLMRTLIVSDIEFRPRDISLEKVHLLNIQSPNGHSWDWKKIPNSSNIMRIYAECIGIDSEATGTIKFDHNLAAKLKGKSGAITVDNIGHLFRQINTYSRIMLNEEIQWLKKLDYTDRIADVLDFLQDIADEFIPAPNSADEQKECALRLGWGIGWKNMTGGWLRDNQSLLKIRQSLRMGKKGYDGSPFPIFPKTRRIIMNDDQAYTQPGWLLLQLQ
jgi:CRISPR-associated protein Csm5